MKILVALFSLVLATTVVAPPVARAEAPPAGATGTVQPVPGPAVRPFDPPETKWAPGHRGVDLLAPPGTTVVAPRAGTVAFLGLVAGKPVVVVRHGDTRTTLEPVRATVRVGDAVAAGDPLGVLEAGHPCPGGTCVHWGLKRDDHYLDPALGVGASEVRLLPESAEATVLARSALRERSESPITLEVGEIGAGALLRPVPGPVSSRFGSRFHPIFHEWRLHAGVDLSAPCGTPIRAAADGVVSSAAFDPSGGWRLVVTHAQHGGRQLRTQYLHAQGYRVRGGQRVSRGEVVGWVGSTGWSTGCHLHFGLKLGDRTVDPLPWIA